MARVKLVEVAEASGKVKEVYNDIKLNFGMVPNLFKAMALKENILEANWQKVKAVMMQGELSRDLKEMVAVVVSRANSCNYCVNAHAAALKMLGIPYERILHIIRDLDGAELSPGVKKVLRFSVKATREPNKITEAEIIEIKDLGYSDAQIVELLSVIDLYTSFNKFLDALQVESDFPEI